MIQGVTAGMRFPQLRGAADPALVPARVQDFSQGGGALGPAARAEVIVEPDVDFDVKRPNPKVLGDPPPAVGTPTRIRAVRVSRCKSPPVHRRTTRGPESIPRGPSGGRESFFDAGDRSRGEFDPGLDGGAPPGRVKTNTAKGSRGVEAGQLKTVPRPLVGEAGGRRRPQSHHGPTSPIWSWGIPRHGVACRRPSEGPCRQSASGRALRSAARLYLLLKSPSLPGLVAPPVPAGKPGHLWVSLADGNCRLRSDPLKVDTVINPGDELRTSGETELILSTPAGNRVILEGESRCLYSGVGTSEDKHLLYRFESPEGKITFEVQEGSGQLELVFGPTRVDAIGAWLGIGRSPDGRTTRRCAARRAW